MHTISQTRDWLILVDSGNFKMDPGELGGGPRTVLIDEDSRGFLVRKDDLLAAKPGTPVAMRPFEIAPTVGHFYAQYDDAQGIQVLWEHMDGVDLGFYLKADDEDAQGDPIDPSLAGFYNMGMRPSSLSEVLIDPETGRSHPLGEVRNEHTFNNQLSAIDWSLEGLSKPAVHHMLGRATDPRRFRAVRSKRMGRECPPTCALPRSNRVL